MLGSAWRCAPLGERAESGVGPDDGALEFLGDDRGMSGRGDVGEVDTHTDAGPGGAGTS